jgi:hypothetical protein
MVHSDKLLSVSLSVHGKLCGGLIRFYVFPYQFDGELQKSAKKRCLQLWRSRICSAPGNKEVQP